MTSAVFSTVLPAVLAIVMLGLGLQLVAADFRSVVTAPRAILVVLFCQVLLLPALGAVLLLVLGPPSAIALGTVVLLASPGGAIAAVFSHLSGGDVVLNISATAVNAALSLVTMPLMIRLAVDHLGVGGDDGVLVPPDKVVQVVLVVLVPAALGMLLRRQRPKLAVRLHRWVRIVAIVAVLLSIVAAVGQQLAGFVRGLALVGGLVLGLSVLSLAVGYLVPRLARLGRAQATASSFEIGIHNVALAITVCVSVLGDPRAAVVPAMYGALMFGPAATLAGLLSRRLPVADRTGPEVTRP